MHFTSYLSIAFMALGLVVASEEENLYTTRSSEPALRGGQYQVDRSAKFTNKRVWTFTGNKLPQGLYASNYVAGNTHSFLPSNVKVRNGYLELIVPGGQTKMPYKCAEVLTSIQNIKYASVRTTAIFSEPAGVCNGKPPLIGVAIAADTVPGNFFYKSDTQEIDIEWLSDRKSESNAGTRRLWFTNQDASGDGQSTFKAVPPPKNPTTTEHEYRIDWYPGWARFYVDGTLIWETNKDVPTEAGSWIWNNWSSGDKGWSVGPPAKEAVFKISKIEMYYNTA
ncbi:hypothetical protein ACHAPT_008921 [Fusarium lateritium]